MKEKEGRSLNFGCDMVIQSINFDQALSKGLNESTTAMSIDLGLSLCGKSITLAKPEPIAAPPAQPAATTSANGTKQSKTPLLDKIEIDSDTDMIDATENKPLQNPETKPQ